MKTPSEILKDAKNAPSKDTLEPHRQTILTLREKNYSWREIADFLSERGVETDHSKLFRYFNKPRSTKMDEFEVPTAERYMQALEDMRTKLTDDQRKMLRFHFRAHNRTATYTELAKAAGKDNFQFANRYYGGLAKDLGDKLDMVYVPLSETNPDRPFYSSAIGTAKKYKGQEWKLIMHHELAKAIEKLPWLVEEKAR